MAAPVEIRRGAVMEYLRQKWSVRLTEQENPVTATVLTTATKVFNNDPDAFMRLAVNLSANDGFMAPSAQVSSNLGIRVGANGGNMAVQADEDGPLVTREWHAINNTAQGTWYFLQVRVSA